MVKFLIIRHGYSVTNKAKKFTGQMDAPLDEIGFEQAKSVGKYISENYKIDKIYSSDLCRACETVRPLAEALGMQIQKEKDFREVDVGSWQNVLIEDINKNFPEQMESYKQNPGIFKFPNGEGYYEMMQRAANKLEEIARENEGKTIAIATHGGVVRALRAYYAGLGAEGIKTLPHVSNASISTAIYENGNVTFTEVDYTDHLNQKVTEEGIK